jgi:hypothetical protein
MTLRSSGVSAAGFSRIRSLIPTFPTSCSSDPKTSCSRRRRSMPRRSATALT